VCDKVSQHTSAQMSLLRSGTSGYRDTSSLAASFHAGEVLPNGPGPHPGPRRSRGHGLSFLRLWCRGIKS